MQRTGHHLASIYGHLRVSCKLQKWLNARFVVSTIMMIFFDLYNEYMNTYACIAPPWVTNGYVQMFTHDHGRNRIALGHLQEWLVWPEKPNTYSNIKQDSLWTILWWKNIHKKMFVIYSFLLNRIHYCIFVLEVLLF